METPGKPNEGHSEHGRPPGFFQLWRPDVSQPGYDSEITAPGSGPGEDPGEHGNDIGAHDPEAVAMIAYCRSQLPAVRERLVPQYEPAGTPEYAQCQDEYWATRHRAHDTALGLTEVLEGYSVEEAAQGVTIHHTVHGRYVLAHGSAVPATVSVRMHFDENGLSDPLGAHAIRVFTSLGDLDGPDPDAGGTVRTYDSWLPPPERAFSAEAFTLPELPELSERIAHQIRYDAWGAGVAPWVESYMAMPPATIEVPLDEGGFSNSPLPGGLQAILAGGEESPEEALTTLRFAFGGRHIGPLLEDLYAMDRQELTSAVLQSGGAERFAWLVENAEAIHASVVAAERTALDNGFRDHFTAWHDRVALAVDEVAALSDELAQLRGVPPVTLPNRRVTSKPPAPFPHPLGPAREARPNQRLLDKIRQWHKRGGTAT